MSAARFFEVWTSFKTEIDKYYEDVTSYSKALEMSKEELKKAEEEDRQTTTAPAVPALAEEGMTDTPEIPADISKTIYADK